MTIILKWIKVLLVAISEFLQTQILGVVISGVNFFINLAYFLTRSKIWIVFLSWKCKILSRHPLFTCTSECR